MNYLLTAAALSGECESVKPELNGFHFNNRAVEARYWPSADQLLEGVARGVDMAAPGGDKTAVVVRKDIFPNWMPMVELPTEPGLYELKSAAWDSVFAKFVDGEWKTAKTSKESAMLRFKRSVGAYDGQLIAWRNVQVFPCQETPPTEFRPMVERPSVDGVYELRPEITILSTPYFSLFCDGEWKETSWSCIDAKKSCARSAWVEAGRFNGWRPVQS